MFDLPASPPVQPPVSRSSDLVVRLRHLAETDPGLGAHLVAYARGDTLLAEGEPNDRLFVLLQGEVTLFKAPGDGSAPLAVSTHGAGDLLGVNSVATRQPSFSTVRARTTLRCLCLDAATLARLPQINAEFDRLLQHLITANLGDRYRAAVQLQVRLARANQELTETRNQLIHQEKMAVLGQLVAGLAHELNNPAAALLRQREHLAAVLVAWLGPTPPPAERALWAAGQHALSIGSAEAREQADRLEAAHPDLPRGLLRRVAAVPAEHWPLLLPKTGATALEPGAERRLAIFEAAHLLQAQHVATTQISHLVTGLKNYARPAGGEFAPLNVRASIEQALVILAHTLKDVPLETELDPSLVIPGRAGDLSQVWTNLLRNAREAAGPGVPLRVVARRASPEEVVVEIIDHGPGVPSGLRERVFDLNYTSKTGRENFGLGLGLSITLSLVVAHGGRIELSDTPGGGATFAVYLPTTSPGKA